MDAQLKAKWVEALRSGNFKQTREGFFKHGKSFCCLGVLCVVAGEPPVLDENRSGNWAFVDGPAGLADVSMTLAEMNDGGTSFAEIADYIEANL